MGRARPGLVGRTLIGGVEGAAPLPAASGAVRPTCRELGRAFTRLSLLGFGGPNAHLALMLDEIVEKRAWVTREHFLHIVAITNLLPGPNSTEVAIHIGHLHRGWRGGLVTGLAFTAPTFVFVVALSAVYFRYGSIPVIGNVFWALGPIVIAIILVAGWKLARAAVTDATLLVLAAGGIATALLRTRWEVAAMAFGGLVAWLVYRRPSGRSDVTDDPSNNLAASAAGVPVSVTPPPAPDATPPRHVMLLLPIAPAMLGASALGTLFLVMLSAGAARFGGGYMLVALLRPHVVDEHGWLTAAQFIDGVAISQAVPGPIVTFAAFIGFAVAGVGGAAIAMAGIYLPSFLAVFAVAPLLERWRHIASVRAALKGVNAVAAGVIMGAALALLRLAVPDPAALGILLVALAAQLWLRAGAAWLIVSGLAAGLLKFALGALTG